MKTKFSLFLASIFAYFSHIFSVWAVSVTPPTGKLPGAASVYSDSSSTTDVFLPNIIAYVISIVAVLAVIAITWAGIQMFLSVGNENKFNQAKNILIYALVGVAVAGLAYVLVNFVANTNF